MRRIRARTELGARLAAVRGARALCVHRLEPAGRRINARPLEVVTTAFTGGFLAGLIAPPWPARIHSGVDALRFMLRVAARLP